MESFPILILFGPTASGKSAIAQALADAIPCVIINADAMQIYRELRILTARPSEQEEQKHPHALYGFLPAATHCSAGLWVMHAKNEIESAWEQKRLPVIIGGTGMYIRTLLEGLSPIPDISPQVRKKIRALATRNSQPATSLHSLLASRDPAMAKRLRPSDTQRILRALEVLEETGQSLSHWQAQSKKPPLPQARFMLCHMDIPREVLYERCNHRFTAMMETGALEEVRHLASLDLPPDLPVMRALGVPELMRYMKGEHTLEVATKKAQQATRNYAKRQLTWGRNQFKEAISLSRTVLENDGEWEETIQRIKNFRKE